MSDPVIQRRSDPSVRRLKLVREGEDPGLVFCEGEKLVDEVIKSTWHVETIFCRPDTRPMARAMVTRYDGRLPIIALSTDVMDFVSDLATAPGLIALARRPVSSPYVFSEETLLLVIHRLQLPQNVGALYRAAEAAGVTRIFLTGSSIDPYGPKVLRAAAGSAFRLAIESRYSLVEALSQLSAAGVRAVAADQRGAVDYDRFDWRPPTALVVGAEGSGFTPGERKLFNATVRIPMGGEVESLNAAVATAVCLFEAARQRRTAGPKE